MDVRGVVEKADLVAKLAEEGGTSAASCSICCEDYESGDPMRVLPCKHRFHVEVRINGAWFIAAASWECCCLVEMLCSCIVCSCTHCARCCVSHRSCCMCNAFLDSVRTSGG